MRFQTFFPYQKKPLKKSIGSLKANVKTRNFSEKIQAIKSLFKLSDGGDLYLFFYKFEWKENSN